MAPVMVKVLSDHIEETPKDRVMGGFDVQIVEAKEDLIS